MCIFYSCLLMIAVFSGTNFQNVNLFRSEYRELKQNQLNGTYEFLSETIILIKPKPSTKRIALPQWQGLWLFQDDHFSLTMMKKGRGFLAYPKTHAEVGYESSAGSYSIEGNIIRLKRDISLHPLSIGRPIIMEFQLEGDILTLIETLRPYTEARAEGQRIVVLRKIS